MCPEVGLEGWLRCFAPRFGGVECRGHAQYPAFTLGSSEVAVGFFGSLCILLSIIRPNCIYTQLLSVPYS